MKSGHACHPEFSEAILLWWENIVIVGPDGTGGLGAEEGWEALLVYKNAE